MQDKAKETEDINDELIIVEYQSKFKNAFRDLNVEWIAAYFKMEEADHLALDDPESYIIKNGGS